MSELVGKYAKTNLFLCQGDITQQKTDVIVNAANSGLSGGGGVDGAIHRAGGASILEECKKIRSEQGKCAPGKAVITSAGLLKAKWVIHAVGPIWQDGTCEEAETLARAYRNSLQLALEAGARSVSFPSISTGAYRYPIGPAATVALGEVKQFAESHPGKIDEVHFVLFDAKTYESYKKAANKING